MRGLRRAKGGTAEFEDCTTSALLTRQSLKIQRPRGRVGCGRCRKARGGKAGNSAPLSLQAQSRLTDVRIDTKYAFPSPATGVGYALRTDLSEVCIRERIRALIGT